MAHAGIALATIDTWLNWGKHHMGLDIQDESHLSICLTLFTTWRLVLCTVATDDTTS